MFSHPSIIGIEIPTNNIFDVNSLALSAILKNNAKSTKWYNYINFNTQGGDNNEW